MVLGFRIADWREVRRVGSRGEVGLRGMRIGVVVAMMVLLEGWARLVVASRGVDGGLLAVDAWLDNCVCCGKVGRNEAGNLR